jgi:hypothetical protein
VDGRQRSRPSLTDLVVEAEDGTVEESVGAAVSAGRRWVGRVRLPGHDGHVDLVHATALPRHDLDGRVAGAAVLALEPDSVLWPLLTGKLDGWLMAHSSGRVKYADPYATARWPSVSTCGTSA